MNGKKGEWENHKTIIERFKVKINPKDKYHNKCISLS